jgi:hypothetical protein
MRRQEKDRELLSFFPSLSRRTYLISGDFMLAGLVGVKPQSSFR